MFILDGQPLNPDLPFEHDGIQYPANWLRLATPEERAAIGITEVPDYPRPDDRFYWCSQNPDGTYESIPKDLNVLKNLWVSNVNQTAHTLLSQTDWMIVRKAETGTAIPANWSTYRDDVRIFCSTIKDQIQQISSVEALISLVNGLQWPNSPNQDA